jgi:hypothetical protein
MIPVFLLALPALVSAAALGGADPLHLPLTRRQESNPDLGYWAQAADNLRKKYGYNTIQKRQTSSSAVPLTNQVCSSSLSLEARFVTISSYTFVSMATRATLGP